MNYFLKAIYYDAASQNNTWRSILVVPRDILSNFSCTFGKFELLHASVCNWRPRSLLQRAMYLFHNLFNKNLIKFTIFRNLKSSSNFSIIFMTSSWWFFNSQNLKVLQFLWRNRGSLENCLNFVWCNFFYAIQKVPNAFHPTFIKKWISSNQNVEVSSKILPSPFQLTLST